jgi:hypothetical protein
MFTLHEAWTHYSNTADRRQWKASFLFPAESPDATSPNHEVRAFDAEDSVRALSGQFLTAGLWRRLDVSEPGGISSL